MPAQRAAHVGPAEQAAPPLFGDGTSASPEEHADAFLAFYREHRGNNWISSNLLRIEVSRAAARNWPALIPDAQRLLDAFEYAQTDEDVVCSAIVEPDRLLGSWTQSGNSTAARPGTHRQAHL